MRIDCQLHGRFVLERSAKHLIVVGGGYIGLEMGSVWRRLGSQVTVVEYADSIVPAMDSEVATTLFKSLKKQGIEFRLSTKVTSVSKDKNGKGVQVVLEPPQVAKARQWHAMCCFLAQA